MPSKLTQYAFLQVPIGTQPVQCHCYIRVRAPACPNVRCHGNSRLVSEFGHLFPYFPLDLIGLFRHRPHNCLLTNRWPTGNKGSHETNEGRRLSQVVGCISETDVPGSVGHRVVPFWGPRVPCVQVGFQRCTQFHLLVARRVNELVSKRLNTENAMFVFQMV